MSRGAPVSIQVEAERGARLTHCGAVAGGVNHVELLEAQLAHYRCSRIYVADMSATCQRMKRMRYMLAARCSRSEHPIQERAGRTVADWLLPLTCWSHLDREPAIVVLQSHSWLSVACSDTLSVRYFRCVCPLYESLANVIVAMAQSPGVMTMILGADEFMPKAGRALMIKTDQRQLTQT